MNFTDPQFLVFLAIVFALYYLPPLRTIQVFVLVLASLAFYAWNQPALLLLLGVTVLISTIVSFRLLEPTRASDPSLWLMAGVTVNLGILGFFKYKALIYQTLFDDDPASAMIQALLDIPLPIGISFYTFHSISLLVDARRRDDVRQYLNRPFAPHMVRTALYLTFFPQLIAGPIVKAYDFYPQIQTKSFAQIDWNGAVKSLIFGCFLKCVVADNLHDQTYWLAFPYFQGLSSVTMLVILFGYSIQIFADFAGYSLIAIGLSGLFGYRLPQNFNFPYISQNFSEFWTRWHMSLSAWLREYLYFSLGGNRLGVWRTAFNLMIVMLLGGLWHGAAWSFALWGAWHGLLLIVERPFLQSWFFQNQFWGLQYLRRLLVFVAVSLGWLLFKLPNIAEVGEFLRSLSVNCNGPLNSTLVLGVTVYALPVMAVHGLYLIRQRINTTMVRAFGYGLLLAAVVLNSGEPNVFIYFQF